MNSCITDVPGIEVGHHTLSERPTGCTVILTRSGATGAVDVRGAAPGTRETDLLEPDNTVNVVHAVVLAGSSAWGLDAASGVMRWLDEQGIGLQVGAARVPIVPAAVLFDLHVGDPSIRVDAHAGHAAAQAANAQACAQGNVGAGAGATVGKLFGMAHAMKGGLGSASVQVGPWCVGAIIACNALGDVRDPVTGTVLAGALSDEGLHVRDSTASLLRGESATRILPGTQTTIGVIACNAQMDKAQTRRLAQSGHDGLARTISPVHTPSDGDTLFALATGHATQTPDLNLLCVMAAEAVALATVRAVRAAQSLKHKGLHLHAALDLQNSVKAT